MKKVVVTVKCDVIDTTVTMTMKELSQYFAGLASWYEVEDNYVPKKFDIEIAKAE